MLVLSHVSPILRGPLRVALGTAHSLVEAADWDNLAETVRRQPVDLIVVDPMAEGAANVVGIQAFRAQFPELRIVVYTGMQPRAMGALAQLTLQRVSEIVFQGFDDTPEGFRYRLERAASRPVPPPPSPKKSLAERMAEEGWADDSPEAEP